MGVRGQKEASSEATEYSVTRDSTQVSTRGKDKAGRVYDVETDSCCLLVNQVSTLPIVTRPLWPPIQQLNNTLCRAAWFFPFSSMRSCLFTLSA